MLVPPALLDGAMGTALIARGLPPGALPEEWIASRPDAIAAVHREHASAGARLLLTCTFNAAAPRLAAAVDPSRLDEMCRRAVQLARSASGAAVVAGDLGPTGLVRPELAPPAAELAERYERPARALAAAGVELLWIETQWDLSEARAALAAARRTGVAAAVTFTLAERDGRLEAPDGTPGEECLAAVAADGAAAAGVNCVRPGPALAALARWAAARIPIPFAAKPSPGLPGAVLAPGAFASAMAPAIAAGARLVGGCCGATGDHLAALAVALESCG